MVDLCSAVLGCRDDCGLLAKRGGHGTTVGLSETDTQRRHRIGLVESLRLQPVNGCGIGRVREKNRVGFFRVPGFHKTSAKTAAKCAGCSV